MSGQHHDNEHRQARMTTGQQYTSRHRPVQNDVMHPLRRDPPAVGARDRPEDPLAEAVCWRVREGVGMTAPTLSPSSVGFCYHFVRLIDGRDPENQRTHEPLGGLVRSAFTGSSGRVRVSASAHQGASAFWSGISRRGNPVRNATSELCHE